MKTTTNKNATDLLTARREYDDAHAVAMRSDRASDHKTAAKAARRLARALRALLGPKSNEAEQVACMASTHDRLAAQGER